ncbi:MAG: AAA family ATPase [Phycisphaerales bacterium]|nr:AAA family ATPase [Phycisphaerales bacterium]
MAGGVRFIILNGDDVFGAQLRGTLLKFDGVRIAAEVDQPAMLAQIVHQVSAEILLMNLDPDPRLVLNLAADLISSHPALSVFATSASTDGQIVIEAMRKGVKEFLPKPLDPQTLWEAIERVAQRRTEEAPQGKLITILSGCGGQGSTMLATNLAVELADVTQGRVALVDLDYRFGQVATFLDIEPTYTLADLCNTVEHVEQSVIEKALVKHETGVRVLARPSHLAQAESLTAAHCVGVLSTLVQFNDYVLLDGPTRFDVGAQSVLDLADINLILVQLLVPSVRNTVRILDGMRDAGYNMERLRLICNRVGKESSHLSVEDVTSTLNLEALVTLPDDWGTVGGGVNLGVPLKTYSPKSRVRLAIRELAEKLTAPPPARNEEEQQAQRKGLMSRIFAER